MAVQILMPALSPTMTDGTLSRWIKKEGDNVEAGQIIAEIETDKATMEVEAVDQGILAKILIPEGTVGVKVNEPIAILLLEDENMEAVEALTPRNTKKTQQSVPLQSGVETSPHSVASDNGQKIFASPLAKRIAKDQNVDLRSLDGTGPGGRIVKNDVLGFLNKEPKVVAIANTINCQGYSAADSDECYSASGMHHKYTKLGNNNKMVRGNATLDDHQLLPISNVRRAIAQRLLEAKQTIPHFYLIIDCEVSELLNLRQKINNSTLPNKVKISVNDFVVMAAALALKAIPEANASWTDKGIIRYSSVDISVAVALEEGLITPIVKHADQKSLSHISNEIKVLAAKARENKLKLDEFQGGSMTVTNLGMYGIHQFSAIINPPQAAILAVGKTIQAPIVKDNEITVGNVISATLSCDHRVIDGALGARFLDAFKQYMENPMLMLI
ncbi:Dihydrolipoyllysine-residue acetyltransferase component of pyruvate dehydrogenase complex [Alphaproteobacteria bacterium]